MKRYEVFLLHISYCVTFETTKALRMPQYDYIRGKEIFFRRVLASSFWFTNFTLNKQCRIISGKASLAGIFLDSKRSQIPIFTALSMKSLSLRECAMFEINAELVQYSVISHAGCTHWNNGKTLECLFANDYVADLFTV